MKTRIAGILGILILIAAGYVCVKYYSYVFAKTVRGEILRVERVNLQSSIITNSQQGIPADLFSFAVSIKDEKGDIYTASSDDRQWAVASPGMCVESKFFPYAPWEFDRASTYHNARLVQLSECKKS